MSWLSDLFNGNKKTDFGAIYPDPPKLRLDDYDLWLTQIDQLIGDWDKIRTGESMFDAVKFIYEPQRAMLEQAYGLGAPGAMSGPNSLGETNDLFARGGTIPRTLSQMNATGTLDSGTAGIVRAQLESQMNKDLSGLFGQAKEVQRGDYFNSLDQLRSLYPERFEVRNIPNYLDYMNATNQYNVASQRNAATEGNRLATLASKNQAMGSLFGSSIDKVASAFGIPTGGMFGNIGGDLANTGMSQYNGTGANLNASMPSYGGGQRMTVNPNAVNQYGVGSPYPGSQNISWATPSYQAPQNIFGPQQQASATNQNTPEMGGSGMDFSKLLKMFMSGGVGAGASAFA
jgi:hypothetical protein